MAGELEFEFSLYQRLGAEMGRQLSVAFHGRASRDPTLGPLFPGKLHCPIRNLGRFLEQLFGGPDEYSRQRYFPNLTEAHARFRIGAAEREAWRRVMAEAMDEVGIGEPERTALLRYFEAASGYLVNDGGEVSCPEVEWASGCPVQQEAAARWKEQLAVEELFRAIRAGDGRRALDGMEEEAVQAITRRDPVTLLQLLSAMGCSEVPALAEYACCRLESEPELAGMRYGGGRTLLHDAAGGWSTFFTECLLKRGANPNVKDDAGHPPLYYAANCGGGPSAAGNPHRGAAVVRMLVQAGADVNASGGVKRCTPLHMAARRGNVPVAEALLAGGADLEARDSQGETPLRRAVNCGKPVTAALLLARGADRDAVGSRGLTPAQAARGAVMIAVFR